MKAESTAAETAETVASPNRLTNAQQCIIVMYIKPPWHAKRVHHSSTTHPKAMLIMI